MAEAYPIELRRRVVEAYEAGEGAYAALAARFRLGEATVKRDESGLNLAMGRSHAWVKKGREWVARRPMNWGKNLTLLGAMRSTGWVLLSSMIQSLNSNTFVCWLGSQLLRRR